LVAIVREDLANVFGVDAVKHRDGDIDFLAKPRKMMSSSPFFSYWFRPRSSHRLRGRH
jgi:hypothetical protein